MSRLYQKSWFISKWIKNQLNVSQFDWLFDINQHFDINQIFQSFNHLFLSFNWIFWSFFSTFIDLLIKNRLKVINLNWKEIQIRSKSQSTIRFSHWILNQTEINHQILTAWNPHHQFLLIALKLNNGIYMSRSNTCT